ncbi:MAG: hypothetical protein RLZZ337_359 [Bacteroidota bacterium]
MCQLGFGQSKVFKGQFRSFANGEPILYGKVVTGKTTRLTNIDGYVEIGYTLGDLITITHLTYDTLEINPLDYAKNDTVIFYLKPRVYVLKEFSFSALGPRVFFDQKFVKNDLGKSDEETIREKLKLIQMRQELIGLDRSAQGGVVLGSPITALYDRYSRAGKEKALYAMLIEQDKLDKAAYKKFDDVIVKTLTSYDDKELQDFIKFCSFHPTYIAAVDALELYYEILHCRDEYETKN